MSPAESGTSAGRGIGLADQARCESRSEGLAHGAHLLPGFDPYTLAPISHREHIIPEGKVDEVSRPRAGSRR